ncbi:uncharacterized protein FYW47_018091 [Aplochiton taeniatus]
MDDDFERRREMRRQKREEMRLEAERMAFQRTDEDEEEAARERRRRARQERMRSRESEEPSGQPDSLTMTNSHSVTETTVSVSSSGGGGDDEEQALQERMAKREERRQKRMQEALDRQRELEGNGEGDHGGFAKEANNRDEEERPSSGRRGRYRDNEEEEPEAVRKPAMYGRRKEEEEEEEQEDAAPEEEEPRAEEEEEEEVEEKPRGSWREQESFEDKPNMSYVQEEEHDVDKTLISNLVVEKITNNEDSSYLEGGVEKEANDSEDANVFPQDEGLEEDRHTGVKRPSGSKAITQHKDSAVDHETSGRLHSENGSDVLNERGGNRDVGAGPRKQNGGFHEDTPPPKQHRKPERTLSRGSARSPESPANHDDQQDDTARLEAERKLEELKRRRDDAESEEFERMRQKQADAELELEELKKKREERKKVLEEEERVKKQEEDERKAKEEEEKRRMKEEIEKRRAEAAEKRQRGTEEMVDGEAKPFKCFSPRGSSMKIGERAEFLNKSAQKSAVKASLSPVVSKIDNRLEQYTSAAQRENRETKSPRSGAVDLPMVTDGIRNIKSMWEKGNVFNSPGGGGGTYKEAAGMKIGVAGRINDWLNKTPESGKTLGGRPADLKPGDVTNKRSLWENKGASPNKVTGRGENKSVTNGMGH